MASIYKLLGTEQTFTVANTFSSANLSAAEGWNLVRVINTSGTTAYTVTTGGLAMTILPLGEAIIEKAANTTIVASNALLLGTAVTFKNN